MNNPLHHILCRLVVVVVAVWMPCVLLAQTYAEYYIDDDLGLGKAVTIGSPIDTDGNLQMDIPTNGVSPGEHILGIRAYSTKSDEKRTITAFGPTIMQRIFVKGNDVAQQVLYAEYFFDEDPGYGKGTIIPVTPGEDQNLENLEIPTTGLEAGEHVFGIRTYGTSGWGATITQRFSVKSERTVQGVLYAEYFFDEDPGYGKGNFIPITPGEDLNLDNLEIPTTGLDAGEHVFGIRTYGTSGWGATITQRFAVKPENEVQQVLYAEYFFDADPGYGKGIFIPVTPGEKQNLDNMEIPTTGLEAGEHVFGIRTYGTSGWGATITQRFAVKPENEVQKVLYAEYFFDEDPGYGKGTLIPVTPGEERILDNLEISTTGLDAGEHNFYIRAYGTKGWGATISQHVVVKGEFVNPQVLYAEYFFGDDPGFGQGIPILITPEQEVSIEDLLLPTDDVHDICILGIRAYSTKGWGPTIITDVMLGAEGNYTLNANAETSLANRNYKSLDDAINDFSECGVRDDVTFTIPTNNTNYTLDATTNDCLTKLTRIAESIDDSEKEKTITFTAEEGSNNRLSITTTEEGLPTVVGLFSHVAISNVALTINGVAYDFTAAATRHQESCSNSVTQLVALSGISSKVKVSWTAQPHKDTSITGYQISGTGDLPAMVLGNSDIECDTLVINVVLSDDKGNTLTTYDYTYIVHARVSNQTFAAFKPSEGSSIDPGVVNIRWKAIGDALGYRLNIRQRPIDDDFADELEQTIETDETQYEVTVESGILYTWTVTAIGYCDELTSEVHSFTGKNVLLGDVNGDGYVTVTDAMATVNHVLGRPQILFYEKNADMNGDGDINVTDVMLIILTILMY